MILSWRARGPLPPSPHPHSHPPHPTAGKSTLLNAVCGAGVLAEDKLFATLDPTTRRVELAGGKQVLFSDTVGFIQKLPTQVRGCGCGLLFLFTLRHARQGRGGRRCCRRRAPPVAPPTP